MSKKFADFPTPIALVKSIIESINITTNHQVWHRVFEPSCGSGNFISVLVDLVPPPTEIQGIELQEQHIINAQKLARESSTEVIIKQGQIFDFNLKTDLQWRGNGNLLVIGNPPWINNSQMGAIAGDNLPLKSNIKKLTGINALTGSSNFDICEYIWIKLITELMTEKPYIALLCKTSVARNVIEFCYHNQIAISQVSLRLIDAKKWFNAGVSACLFSLQLGGEEVNYQAQVYGDLKTTKPDYTLGIINGQLVADVNKYESCKFADGQCHLIWRQGIKHDAASVMELTNNNGMWYNKLGEKVIIESEYIYPLLKSSDLFHGDELVNNRGVIVTQKYLGEDTRDLAIKAPKLNDYLNQYGVIFDQRKSSIYNKQPKFAMFGIGDYTFSPYKVAISGLHKQPKFRAIGLRNNKPVIFDDTCYFIPIYSPEETAILTSLLNHPFCLDLLKSLMFIDAKRPITKKLLQRIDLQQIFTHIDQEDFLFSVNRSLAHLTGRGNLKDLDMISKFLFTGEIKYQQLTFL